MGGMAIQPIATILILNMVGKKRMPIMPSENLPKKQRLLDCLTCI
ncbi:hypothetical protein I131_13285 [Enterococcus faecium CRL1879]|nr:hypothetical protein I131_13285 [Enterococcus faecium CRL1879]